MASTKRRNGKKQELWDDLVTDWQERERDFITYPEFLDLLASARKSRYNIRNVALIMTMYRHGLRVSELCNAQIGDVDFKSAIFFVRRLKDGLSTAHPLEGDELRALKRHLRERDDSLPWLFVSNRQQQFTRQTIGYHIRTLAKKANIPIDVHPHTLRHGCGYYLANKGVDSRIIQDWLGHRDPKHTARYTRIALGKFRGLFG